MVVLLLPLVAVILLCYYTRFPVDLLHDTDVPYIDSTLIFQVAIQDYPTPRQKTIRYTAEVLAVVDSMTHTAPSKVYLYIQPDSTRPMPTMGDTLLVRTRIQRGERLGRFDYGTYLRQQGIAGTGIVWHNQWQYIGHSTPQRFSPKQWQHSLQERYQRCGLEGKELATIAALTLGYKEDLDRKTTQSFQRAGAAHILAVSGLHTGIIYSILLLILTLGGRFKPLYTQRLWRCVQSVIIIAAMWAYAGMTGMTPSVVRSVLMLSLVEVGRMLYRQSLSLNTVAAAAFLILIVRPLDLFSVSFQLSFAAVVALLLFVPAFSRLLSTGWIRPVPLRKTARYVADILAVSLAAQIGTLPLTLYYFGQCSNYFLLTNLLVIPIAWLLVVAAFVVLAVGGLPWIGSSAAWMCKGLAWLLNTSVEWIEHLPGAVSEIRISLPMAILLYTAIAGGYWSLKRSLWWLLPTAGCLILFCYLYTVV